MINKVNGKIKINEKLVIDSEFTFKDFKRTCYYNNQNEERMIYLEGEQIIDNNKFYVRFFFRNNLIYSVLLMVADTSISEENEMQRKKIHDEILTNTNIVVGKEYVWGKVLSEYDGKSNCCDIIIIYKHN
ncbi:MAG: hypothetical protein WAX04_11845 [Oscillospiraceae bacterium]